MKRSTGRAPFTIQKSLADIKGFILWLEMKYLSALSKMSSFVYTSRSLYHTQIYRLVSRLILVQMAIICLVLAVYSFVLPLHSDICQCHWCPLPTLITARANTTEPTWHFAGIVWANLLYMYCPCSTFTPYWFFMLHSAVHLLDLINNRWNICPGCLTQSAKVLGSDVISLEDFESNSFSSSSSSSGLVTSDHLPPSYPNLSIIFIMFLLIISIYADKQHGSRNGNASLLSHWWSRLIMDE